MVSVSQRTGKRIRTMELISTTESGRTISVKVCQTVSFGIVTWMHEIKLDGSLVGFSWYHKTEDDARRAASLAVGFLESAI